MKPDPTLRDQPVPNPTSSASFARLCSQATPPPPPISNPDLPTPNPHLRTARQPEASEACSPISRPPVAPPARPTRPSLARDGSPRHSLTPHACVPAQRIMARIRHLQSQAATSAIMNLREILEFLTRVKRTPIGQIDAGSDLVRRFIIRPDGTKSVSMLDKRACVELAARLQGFPSSPIPDFRSSNPDVRSTNSNLRRRLPAADQPPARSLRPFARHRS